jgi:hypothetical protein
VSLRAAGFERSHEVAMRRQPQLGCSGCLLPRSCRRVAARNNERSERADQSCRPDKTKLPLRPFKSKLSGFFVPRGPVRESSRSIAICHEEVLILTINLANARVVDFSFLLVYLFPSAIMLRVLKTHSGLEDDVFVEAQEVRALNKFSIFKL